MTGKVGPSGTETSPSALEKRNSEVGSGGKERRNSKASWKVASGESSPSGESGLKRKKSHLAAKFTKSFIPASTHAPMDEESRPRFQRVQNNDPALRQPRSFVEFYRVVTAGRRDANAFIDSKVDPLGFADAVHRLRSRLKRSNFMLLSPSSKRMQYWDMFMLGLLVFTATVTPYEVCMMWEPTTVNTLYVVNLLVTVSFIVDLTFNFFLPYRTTNRQGMNSIVKSHRGIALHYLRGYFLVDLISVIPIDTILMQLDLQRPGDASYVDGQVALTEAGLEALRIVRMLRLLRLIKLFRILRASRIFARWEGAITINYSDRELIRWMVIVLILLHWLACALGLLAQLSPTQRSPLLQQHLVQRIDEGLDDVALGYGNQHDLCYGCVSGHPVMNRFCSSTCLTPCEIDLLARQQISANAFKNEIRHQRAMVLKAQTWICRYNQLGLVELPEQSSRVWIAGMYVAMIMLSGGVGSIYPENAAEYVLFIAGILIGSVIWAMVVGTICAMATTGDPHTIEYRQHMDSLNSFLSETHVPEELGIQARTYLRATRDLRKKLGHDELISRLSPGLRGEIMLFLSKATFSHVWYFASLEADCLVQLAARLHRHGFPPRERIESIRLNILKRGIAARGGELIYSGMCWGIDMILASAVLRDTRPITALTYVEVQTLSREDLYDVLETYPDSAKVVQNAAVRVALKRTVILLKAHADSQHATAAATSSAAELQEGSSRAYNMLTAAFASREAATSDVTDLGSIFRIITGSRLRDLDEDGNLIEQVESAPAARLGMPDSEEQLRRSVDTIGTEVLSLKASVSMPRPLFVRSRNRTSLSPTSLLPAAYAPLPAQYSRCTRCMVCSKTWLGGSRSRATAPEAETYMNLSVHGQDCGHGAWLEKAGLDRPRAAHPLLRSPSD
jgi:hypothetical protein